MIKCHIYGVYYDREETARIHGDQWWADKLCSAQCYTKFSMEAIDGARAVREADMVNKPEETLNLIGNTIQTLLNKDGLDYGWAIITFPAADDGTGSTQTTYLSNCQKEAMIELLRAQADVLEGELATEQDGQP